MTIFRDTRFSWLWTVVRVYLGYQWLEAGLHKITDPKWVAGGESLQGYWARAAAIPETGRPLITYDWYRGFIQGLLDAEAYTWFAPLVAWGEVLVGIALILGVVTIFAAVMGAVMNLAFMLAGSASTNPVLYTLAILIIVAGANAYYWGVDRWLLPKLPDLFRSRATAVR